MERSVVIDCFPESVRAYGDGWAVVAVDVIRATTTAVTAAALGRRVFPVGSIEAAVPLAARLPEPLLVGELGGNMPYGFDVTNSPAALAERTDVERPMILLSTSGTRVIEAAAPADAVYVGCLRNHSAQAAHLAAQHERVAIVGAGTRGEFREEDQLGCAWIAQGLLGAGFAPQNEWTSSLVGRWRDAPVDAICTSKSVAYLRDTEQTGDLDFVLGHVDDVDAVFAVVDGELARA